MSKTLNDRLGFGGSKIVVQKLWIKMVKYSICITVTKYLGFLN